MDCGPTVRAVRMSVENVLYRKMTPNRAIMFGDGDDNDDDHHHNHNMYKVRELSADSSNFNSI